MNPTSETKAKDEVEEPLIETHSEMAIDEAPDAVEQPVVPDVTTEVRELPPLEASELFDDQVEADILTVDPESTVLPAREHVAPEFLPGLTVIERPEDKPAEKEVVIERRGSGIALPVVLVGAEYLARKHADRKLEAKFSEKSETLEKEVKQGDMAREQLNTLVQQNKEQLEKLKRERQPILEEQPVYTAEKSPIEKTEPKYERIAQMEAPKPQTRTERIEPAVQEKEAARKEQHRIMEQVADAAEHDVPVEKAFERSHEVKDDISTPSSAASIGAIMAAQAEEQRRVARVQAVERQMGDSTQGLPVINSPQTPDMYKQAMKRGFWGAISIIILGIIAYLVK